MEGITEGVRALLQSLDPRAFELGGGGGLFSGSKKARTQWNAYVEQFDQLVTHDEQLHGAIFGDEFARAYASVTRGRARGADDDGGRSLEGIVRRPAAPTRPAPRRPFRLVFALAVAAGGACAASPCRPRSPPALRRIDTTVGQDKPLRERTYPAQYWFVLLMTGYQSSGEIARPARDCRGLPTTLQHDGCTPEPEVTARLDAPRAAADVHVAHLGDARRLVWAETNHLADGRAEGPVAIVDIDGAGLAVRALGVLRAYRDNVTLRLATLGGGTVLVAESERWRDPADARRRRAGATRLRSRDPRRAPAGRQIRRQTRHRRAWPVPGKRILARPRRGRRARRSAISARGVGSLRDGRGHGSRGAGAVGAARARRRRELVRDARPIGAAAHATRRELGRERPEPARAVARAARRARRRCPDSAGASTGPTDRARQAVRRGRRARARRLEHEDAGAERDRLAVRERVP